VHEVNKSNEHRDIEIGSMIVIDILGMSHVKLTLTLKFRMNFRPSDISSFVEVLKNWEGKCLPHTVNVNKRVS
jgi:hypothetical protein